MAEPSNARRPKREPLRRSVGSSLSRAQLDEAGGGEVAAERERLADPQRVHEREARRVDTFEHLRGAGIAWAGAGESVEAARAPVVVDGLPILAFCDHEPDFAALPSRPGIAYADHSHGVPDWLRERAPGALVCPHWGPNMTPAPLPYVRAAAGELRQAGAALVAGTSAHVFQGVEGNVLYDLGDFLDDYAVHPQLRNDYGVLFLVELDPDGLHGIEVVPLKIEFAYTRLARGEEAAWIRRRYREACAELGAG